MTGGNLPSEISRVIIGLSEAVDGGKVEHLNRLDNWFIEIS